MSNDPTPYQLPLETVVIELDHLPDGRECFNVRCTAIQHTGAIWEKVIHVIQGGLRAAIAQTCQPQAEATRIVTPGFVLPPSSDRP